MVNLGDEGEGPSQVTDARFGFTGPVTTRLLLIADTHVPKRARDLPARVWAEVERADVVVHAGDWVDVRLLDELQARAPRLVAVWGNNDHGALRERLTEVARFDVEAV